MVTTSNDATVTADREIVLTRELPAPRDLVWRVYTDRGHVEQWWGPRGFTITVHEMDVRPGGIWRFMMHGPDGTDYPNRIDFIEVTPPERLIFNHGDDDGTRSFHVTITFTEQATGTLVTQRSVFPTAEALAQVIAFGAVELGKQTLDRLAEHLVKVQG